MKYWIFFLLVLPLNLSARKQGRLLIDTLLIQLQHSADTNKVKILDNIAYSYSTISPDSGLYYAQQALDLANKLQWKPGIALTNNGIGLNYEAKSDQANALKHYGRSLALYEELGYGWGMATEFTNIGTIYAEQGRYDSAVAFYFKALKIYDVPGNEARKAMLLEDIGMVYMEQKLYDKSLAYYQEALALYQKTGNKQNTGTVLENMGTLLNNQGKYDAAIEKYGQALAIHTELGNKRSVENTLSCMGDTYNKMKDYAKALGSLQQALALSKETRRAISAAIAAGNIGETWFMLATDKHAAPDKDALKKAIDYLSQAVAQCRDLNFLPPMLEFQEFLSRAYAHSGQHERAYKLLVEYTRLKDSIFTMETKLQMAGLENKRQLDLKDRDILLQQEKLKVNELQLAKKHNDQILYIVSLLLMLLVTLSAVKLYLKYKKSNRALQKEKEEHLNRIRMHIKRIKEQSDMLDEISHTQSHEVRGPVATILGLTQVFNFENYSDPSNKIVVDGISAVALKLDHTIQEIIRKENSLTEKDQPKL